MTTPGLGIEGYDSYSFIVENLERSRAFYVDKLDFREVAQASDAWRQEHGEEAVVFGAGDVRVLVRSPLTQRSWAARYLKRHPAGIPELVFRVKDLDATRKLLDSRNATFLAETESHDDGAGGSYRSFSIATPLGDVAFRFVERKGYKHFAPGFENAPGNPLEGANRYGFTQIDHVTSNARTMAPIIRWYEEVLGMGEYWNIEFHTQDVAKLEGGSGLKSIVMHEPESDIKFATNEPLAPHFEESQIALFVSQNAGAGIQHIAFAVPDIIGTIRTLKTGGVPFLNTPSSYYRYLPERLEKLGISNVKEELETLEQLEILLDGEDDTYMLQIFLRDAAATYEDERAGPFFYEIIQRAGHPGFGYGNFRALFESIEREQSKPETPAGLSGLAMAKATPDGASVPYCVGRVAEDLSERLVLFVGNQVAYVDELEASLSSPPPTALARSAQSLYGRLFCLGGWGLGRLHRLCQSPQIRGFLRNPPASYLAPLDARSQLYMQSEERLLRLNERAWLGSGVPLAFSPPPTPQLTPLLVVVRGEEAHSTLRCPGLLVGEAEGSHGLFLGPGLCHAASIGERPWRLARLSGEDVAAGGLGAKQLSAHDSFQATQGPRGPFPPWMPGDGICIPLSTPIHAPAAAGYELWIDGMPPLRSGCLGIVKPPPGMFGRLIGPGAISSGFWPRVC